MNWSQVGLKNDNLTTKKTAFLVLATCPAIQCPGEGYVGKDCGCKCPSGDPNNPVQNCASIPQTTTTTQSTTTGSTASTTTGSTVTTTTGSTVTTTTGSTVSTTTTSPSSTTVGSKFLDRTFFQKCCRCHTIFDNFFTAYDAIKSLYFYSIQFCVLSKMIGTFLQNIMGISSLFLACNNRHRYCGFWARFGFCTRSRFMRLYCRQSCNLCDGKLLFFKKGLLATENNNS